MSAFEIRNSASVRPLLLVCDHAGQAVPEDIGDLGIGREQMNLHIAFDLGAAALTRQLSDAFACRAVLGRYSRLVVDLNREPEHATAILTESDGTVIPVNCGLTPSARRLRIEHYHRPYHLAIEEQLAALEHHGQQATLIAIHSFTPALAGEARPWHAGVLWDEDARVALPLLQALRAIPGMLVGDNLPYSGRYPADYTMHRHGATPRRRHVCIEVRQDEIADEAGVTRWVRRLHDSLLSFI